MNCAHPRYSFTFVALSALLLLLAACGSATPDAADSPAASSSPPPAVVEGGTTAANAPETSAAGEAEHEDDLAPLALPELKAIASDNPLRAVATTSIIGDVVGQVGGDAVELTTLMGPGQDPHSYQPSAADLTAVANADVIFINGWDLEEGLVDDLATIGESAVIVPISAGVAPLPFGDESHGDEEAGHGSADPHTWLAVENVVRWTGNVAEVLSTLDPSNAGLYTGNAVRYQTQLDQLDQAIREQLATIPETQRVLVTNHDAFGYFAAAYGFEVLGTIIPAASTLAEPTANELARLINDISSRGVCTIFSESTTSDRLGQTVAAELDECDSVQVLQLYSGSLGPAGSGADNYIGMMQANVDTIVSGLK